MSAATRIEHLRQAFPEAGLFRDKEWRLAPEPFPLDAATVRLIESLGPALRAFQNACNRLYFASLESASLAWVAQLLDQGKPAELVALGRHPRWRDALPGVLRPDLVLTEDGVCISELDSLPGGIGLTGWLNETYAALGDPVLGGGDGMSAGFASAFPDADILISRESADYQPEMEWLAAHAPHRDGRLRRVLNPWSTRPEALAGSRIYRFFELFDLDQVEHSAGLLRLANEGEIDFTPPLKAFLEEKLWLALFHSPPLQAWWQSQLATPHLELLRRCIPRGWVVDPAPLPPHAVWPGLNIQDWREARAFGGSRRRLVLKISGFSELGWGSRGVFIGHDLSQEQWSGALDTALNSFPTNPYLLQEFHAGRLVEQPYWDDKARLLRGMRARARLCPYYFVPEGTEQIRLGGVLATVCPADKKILHGMRDAVMLPCMRA
jgi:hypothetical protein